METCPCLPETCLHQSHLHGATELKSHLCTAPPSTEITPAQPHQEHQGALLSPSQLQALRAHCLLTLMTCHAARSFPPFDPLLPHPLLSAPSIPPAPDPRSPYPQARHSSLTRLHVAEPAPPSAHLNRCHCWLPVHCRLTTTWSYPWGAPAWRSCCTAHCCRPRTATAAPFTSRSCSTRLRRRMPVPGWGVPQLRRGPRPDGGLCLRRGGHWPARSQAHTLLALCTGTVPLKAVRAVRTRAHVHVCSRPLRVCKCVCVSSLTECVGLRRGVCLCSGHKQAGCPR